MNKKKYIWEFLENLQANNSKDWMDENRKQYQTAKQYWLDEIASILEKLAKHDPSFANFQPKGTISRINNNRMFHPDKPIYKGHFSFAPINKTDQVAKIYFAYGPEFTFVGGGLYRPEKAGLESVRAAIDYDAQELLDIVNDSTFQKIFGGLAHDPTQLKTSPRGYDKDHPHIDLIRRKSFTGSFVPSKKQLIDQDLSSLIEESFLALQPLVNWLDKAVSV